MSRTMYSNGKFFHYPIPHLWVNLRPYNFRSENYRIHSSQLSQTVYFQPKDLQFSQKDHLLSVRTVYYTYNQGWKNTNTDCAKNIEHERTWSRIRHKTPNMNTEQTSNAYTLGLQNAPKRMWQRQVTCITMYTDAKLPHFFCSLWKVHASDLSLSQPFWSILAIPCIRILYLKICQDFVLFRSSFTAETRKQIVLSLKSLQWRPRDFMC